MPGSQITAMNKTHKELNKGVGKIADLLQQHTSNKNRYNLELVYWSIAVKQEESTSTISIIWLNRTERDSC